MSRGLRPASTILRLCSKPAPPRRSVAGRLLVFGVALAAAVLTVGCTLVVDPQARPPYDNFRTAAARGPEEGYTAYWLGRRVTAGNLEFVGPIVSDDWDDHIIITGGGVVWMRYNATSAERRLRVGEAPGPLSILVYAQAAWIAQPQIGRDYVPLGSTQRAVTVAGRPGTLITERSATGRLDRLRLIIDFSPTMVVADAVRSYWSTPYTLTPKEPDPALDAARDPLMDEATFLAVMENIRPYPQ